MAASFTLFPREVEEKEDCRAACSGRAPCTGNIPEEPVFNGGDLGLHSSAEKLWAAKGRCSDTQLMGSLQTPGPFPLGKDRVRPPAIACLFLIRSCFIWRPKFCDCRAKGIRPENPS